MRNTSGIADVRNPVKSTKGSTTGVALTRGRNGPATVRNPGKNSNLGGGHPSRGGFSTKHVSTKATPPSRGGR
ncbi:MAG TPA: hypothetical protein VNM91_11805 [Dehalococcoidia bacterium]|nr:hypothetical protein [Dehalococcoidia bacterium]